MEEDEDVPIILGRPFLATGQALIDVQMGELRLRVQRDEVVFNVFKGLKYPSASDSCFSVSVLEEQEEGVKFIEDPLELSFGVTSLVVSPEECDGTEANEYVKWLISEGQVYKKKYEELGQVIERPLPSIKKPPVLELKTLPERLRYAYLGENNTLPVIILASLSPIEEEKLLRMLRAHKLAIGWTLADIKGISPSKMMHCILMEEDSKPSIDAQRRLNPLMKEVVSKKGGMMVVKNDNNELIPTRTLTWWRICIDYRKQNKETRKDHFPLPFVDQMLDRLAGHPDYWFLDGYSGYNKIPIAPEDQEKTTFMCPYGTFAIRRILFGLCNAPATFQ
ncbi:uncharacterized protein LOC133825147 [Humulus lupulus]|uniref:uncharacterized protein LOC133825147 n=1 Tax=Humulus lupulus TaxID=3486 RepID=UPI002B41123F|nr:uncharacterized protein LOC133825147 [Humulus lupulus]